MRLPRGTLPAGLFTLALAVRVGHLIAFRSLAYYRLPFGDSRTFATEAHRILTEGALSGDLPTFQGPLYPLFLALVQSLGLPLDAAYWIQCVTGSLSVVLVYLIASRLAGVRSGAVAGALYALYDAAVFLDVDLLAASLVITLTLLGLWLLLGGRDRLAAGRPRAAIALAAAGICLGLAAWGRPNLALPVLVLAIWAPFLPDPAEEVAPRAGTSGRRNGATGPASGENPARRSSSGGTARRSTRGGAMPFLISTVLVLLLPPARNLTVSGEPVFISSGGGVNFYIGNHRGATGLFRTPPESGLTNDLELEGLSREVASRSERRALSPGETSRWWFRRGLSDLLADPAAAVRLYARKVALLASPREIPNHLDPAFIRLHSPVLRSLPVRAWLLIALGVGGAIRLRRSRTARPLLVFTIVAAASVLPFFITARYRLPVMPLLAIFGGTLVVALAEALRGSRVIDRGPGSRRRIAGTAAALAVGVGAALVGLLPHVPRSDFTAARVNLGALHAELGELPEAERELRRALEESPGDPRAMENLGLIALQSGDLESALTWIDGSIARDPGSFYAWNVRGVVLGRLGRFDEAIASFERSLEILPGWSEATHNLGLTWRQYWIHAQRLAGDAGIRAPRTPDEFLALARFLDSTGLHRMAAQLRTGRLPPLDEP